MSTRLVQVPRKASVTVCAAAILNQTCGNSAHITALFPVCHQLNFSFTVADGYRYKKMLAKWIEIVFGKDAKKLRKKRLHFQITEVINNWHWDKLMWNEMSDIFIKFCEYERKQLLPVTGQRSILGQKGLSWFKSGSKIYYYFFKHCVRHVQWHWTAQRLQFYIFSTISECYLSAHPLLSSLPPLQGKVSQFGPSCPLLRLPDRKCVCECPPVGSAGMNMPLHQISVIPRDVTSSRVCGNGKAKDKDKQVWGELCGREFPLLLNCCIKVIQYVWPVPSI